MQILLAYSEDWGMILPFECSKSSKWKKCKVYCFNFKQKVELYTLLTWMSLFPAVVQ